VQERDRDLVVVGLRDRVEAEAFELPGERLRARARPSAPAGIRAPRAPDRRRFIGVGADALGERGEQSREQRVARRIEAEARCAGRERVDVLRTADGAAAYRFDFDQAGFSQLLEVQPDRVGVDAQAIGELVRAERVRRRRQLPIHRVAGLVAEGLEHGEHVHPS
jgi:hypothetical protein